MNTLILGGSRFVGLHLVQELVREGHQVTVLNRGVIPVEYPPGVRHLQADRLDREAYGRALEEATFDAVFDIPVYTVEEVRSAVEALKGKVGHYLFCSSTAVYAPTETFPITEDFPLLRDPAGRKYSLQKVACEEYLNEASQKYGFSVTHIRPTNIYGPGDAMVDRVLSHFARLEQGRRVLLPAYGLTMAPSVHVDDVARLFIHAMGNPAAYGQAFNAVQPQVTSLRGWVRALGQVVGVEPEIVPVPTELDLYVEWPSSVPRTGPEKFPFEWRNTMFPSTEKAIQLLGFAHRYTLLEGLKQTYEWYRQQPKDRWSWDFSREDECLRKMGLA